MNSYMSEAYKLFDKGARKHFNDITMNCSKAIRNSNNRVDIAAANFLLGVLYSKVILMPTPARNAYLDAGEILRNIKDSKNAMDSFARAFNMDKKCVKMSCSNSIVYMEEEHCDNEELPESYTKFASEFYKLYKEGEYEEAKKKCLQAINEDKDNAKAYHCLGFVYIALGEFDDATKSFLNAGEKYGMEKCYQEAINSFKLAIKYNYSKKSFDAYIELARTYDKANRHVDAGLYKENFVKLVDSYTKTVLEDGKLVNKNAVKEKYSDVYVQFMIEERKQLERERASARQAELKFQKEQQLQEDRAYAKVGNDDDVKMNVKPENCVKMPVKNNRQSCSEFWKKSSIHNFRQTKIFCMCA